MEEFFEHPSNPIEVIDDQAMIGSACWISSVFEDKELVPGTPRLVRMLCILPSTETDLDRFCLLLGINRKDRKRDPI